MRKTTGEGTECRKKRGARRKREKRKGRGDFEKIKSLVFDLGGCLKDGEEKVRGEGWGKRRVFETRRSKGVRESPWVGARKKVGREVGSGVEGEAKRARGRGGDGRGREGRLGGQKERRAESG